MKILVTGGAGFIGSHVTDAFLEAGHKLVVVDNLSTGYLHNLNPAVKFYEADICSEELDKIFAEEKPDIVDHHAAQVSVPLSIENPLKDVQSNVVGLVNLLQCCMKHKVRKIIYISSGGAIYGEASEYPTTENYNPKPLSVYAINKMVGENYLYLYKHVYGLDYTVLRYANVYGPRQVSHGEAGVVSIFVQKMLKNEIPTLNHYPDEPQGMIRDYVYVKDAVKANLLALDNGSAEAFNIGTCVETSTKRLFDEIAGQIGLDVEPQYATARAGDLKRSLLDYSKAASLLAWRPSYVLQEGISETIEFFKSGKMR